MPVPSQGHYGFPSFPVVDWFCLFIYLWVLTFPLKDCSEFGNFVITLISSTNKTDHHDLTVKIVESGVKHHKPNQNKTCKQPGDNFITNTKFTDCYTIYFYI